MTWSITLLLIGVAIYILFRKDILFVQFFTGISDGPLFIKSQQPSPILCFIVYCLPDGLWYASLLLLLNALSSDDNFFKAINIVALASPFILEILQLTKTIPGTFDIFDIITYAITLIIIYMKSIKRFLQCLSLVAFVAMALACASSSPNSSLINGVGIPSLNGNGGDSGTPSDGSQNIETTDSIFNPQPEYAMAE